MNWTQIQNFKKSGKALYVKKLENAIVWNTLNIVANNPGITTTEVMIRLRCIQCEASAALAILLKLNLVTVERKGVNRFYEISDYSFKFVKAINNLYVNNRDPVSRSIIAINTTI